MAMSVADTAGPGQPEPSIPGVKQIVAHRAECWCENEPLSFICHRGMDFGRDVLGRRGGSRAWHRFICNDPACPAVVIVRWDVLAGWIEAALYPCSSENPGSVEG